MNTLPAKKYSLLIKVDDRQFTYPSLENVLAKLTKTTQDQERKQLDTIMIQIKRQSGLVNKNGRGLYHRQAL